MNEQPIFAEGFGRFVCEGDYITAEAHGFTFKARVERDDDDTPPWKREDGHGPVSDWTSRQKQPGERVLNEYGRSNRFYDFAEACKIALRDGWGTKDGRQPGETAKAYAARAAEQDYATLKAWCKDEWFYCGIVVTVERENVELVAEYFHALWGIECNYPGADNSYLTEVANDLAAQALPDARAKLAKLAKFCTSDEEGAQ
jgi:hypothetical protein